MRPFEEVLKEYQDYIEAYLKERCFRYESEPQQILFDSMRYSLLAGGKRLRPVFVFAFCALAGGDWKKAAPFAAAMEMVHTYSLIHDDLPCMDNDDYRRGKLTNHKVYGDAVAVLAGDALLTAAFRFIADADYPADIKVRAVSVLASCAGECGMVGGQVLDMLAEERECTKQDVLEIQTRKTGALIRAACQLGVIAGGADEQLMTAASEYASHLGLAFQIRDDMLDVIGTLEDLGKAVGVDAHKNTFVQLYGLDACDRLVREHTDMAIKALSGLENTDFPVSLAQSLTNRNK